MEDGLVPTIPIVTPILLPVVLILVVMEDGLVLSHHRYSQPQASCLNPCCNGRWSRTRPYKTLLIINKLKNLTKEIFTFLNLKLTIP